MSRHPDVLSRNDDSQRKRNFERSTSMRGENYKVVAYVPRGTLNQSTTTSSTSSTASTSSSSTRDRDKYSSLRTYTDVGDRDKSTTDYTRDRDRDKSSGTGTSSSRRALTRERTIDSTRDLTRERELTTRESTRELTTRESTRELTTRESTRELTTRESTRELSREKHRESPKKDRDISSTESTRESSREHTRDRDRDRDTTRREITRESTRDRETRERDRETRDRATRENSAREKRSTYVVERRERPERTATVDSKSGVTQRTISRRDHQETETTSTREKPTFTRDYSNSNYKSTPSTPQITPIKNDYISRGASISRRTMNYGNIPPISDDFKPTGVNINRVTDATHMELFKPTIIGTSTYDNWLTRLFKKENLKESELKDLCDKVSEIFAKESNVRYISGAVTIVGDIHGQWYDLVHRVFVLGSDPLSTNYVFLGDYVDRGLYSLECVCLIFTLKLKFPDSVIVLRGNHESRQISQINGFYEQCMRLFGSATVWNYFNDVFDLLPLSVVIQNKYFATHGGLSPKLDIINDILYLDRKKEIPESGAVCDLLWSDPDDEVDGWKMSPRGSGWLFGYDVSKNWNYKNGLDILIRAHQLVHEGFLYSHNKQVVTLFSAPNYVYRCGNRAAIMKIKEDGSNEIISYDPAPRDSEAQRLQKDFTEKLPALYFL
jgi:serine/threonine-protein phosphatase 2A catalytic subunit